MRLRNCAGLIVLLLVLCAGPAVAQQRLEIIPLQHRLPDQVLPALQPLVEAGGSLTAANNKLILRASPANIAQIRRALEAIDTPQRRLMISVRQGRSSGGESTEAGISSGRVVIGPDGRVRASGALRADNTTDLGSSNVQQRVQTVEGGDASIFLGRSLPLPMRQALVQPGGGVVFSNSVQYVDVGSGFTARPELLGERVVLTISPQMQRADRFGNIEGSRLSTQVEGHLGEWMMLGGGSIERSDSRRGTAEYQAGRESQSGEVWLKVELLD